MTRSDEGTWSLLRVTQLRMRDEIVCVSLVEMKSTMIDYSMDLVDRWEGRVNARMMAMLLPNVR